MYRRDIPAIVNQKQIEASNSTICILQHYGPMGFLLQEENHANKFKVYIGQKHTCSCKQFLKDKDLCKHICWVLLKKFRLDKNNPLSWQLGLNEYEIENMLKVHTASLKINEENVTVNCLKSDLDNAIEQRPINTNDLCPICQDEFLTDKRLPVTFCRLGCGNNVHIKCMQMWREHQQKKSDDLVTCPMCRGSFAKASDLIKECFFGRQIHSKQRKSISSTNNNMTASLVREFELSSVHLDSFCNVCDQCPVIGRIYKLQKNTCADQAISEIYYCGNCFRNKAKEGDEIFLWKDKPKEKWIQVSKSLGLISGCNTEVNKPINYDDGSEMLLTEPLSQTELARIPRWSIRSAHGKGLRRSDLSSVSGLLALGRQCLICLIFFHEGDNVRKLPGCEHIFHSSCIDPWLLHSSPCCPLDKRFAAPSKANLRIAESNIQARRTKSILDLKNKSPFTVSDGMFRINGVQMSSSRIKASRFTDDSTLPSHSMQNLSACRIGSGNCHSKVLNSEQNSILTQTSAFKVNNQGLDLKIGGHSLRRLN